MKKTLTKKDFSYLCPLNRDDFEVVEGGHYCESCEQKVFDVSDCSMDEIMALKKKYGKLCVSFKKIVLATTLVWSVAPCDNSHDFSFGDMFADMKKLATEGHLMGDMKDSSIEDYEEEKNEQEKSKDKKEEDSKTRLIAKLQKKLQKWSNENIFKDSNSSGYESVMMGDIIDSRIYEENTKSKFFSKLQKLKYLDNPIKLILKDFQYQYNKFCKKYTK